MERLTDDVGVFHPHVRAVLRTLSAAPLKAGEARAIPHPFDPGGPVLLVQQTRHGSDWWIEWDAPVLN